VLSCIFFAAEFVPSIGRGLYGTFAAIYTMFLSLHANVNWLIRTHSRHHQVDASATSHAHIQPTRTQSGKMRQGVANGLPNYFRRATNGCHTGSCDGRAFAHGMRLQ
jgi:hypothetical protein